MSARFFLRWLAVVYLLAFWSLGTQILGLVGSHGILPVADFLPMVKQYLGPKHVWQLPTLCWLNASDAFLLFLCAGGCVLAVFLACGILPWLSAFLLWLFYLSITVAGQTFLGFQWDNLLLETGFLAIFLLPPRWHWRWQREDGPSWVIVWLLRLVLFKMMFQSGVVKLLSGDPHWANMTALHYHYLTQPLPNAISWYFAQLPMWFDRLSCILVFALELVVPFFMFCGRIGRWAAFWSLSALQVLIILTGNYGFFNILTIGLCFALLDDAQLAWLFSFIRRPEVPQPRPAPRWYKVETILVGLIVFGISAIQMGMMFDRALPKPLLAVVRFSAPFRSINNYGLFAVMTTERDEIVLEGSNDGRLWKPYAFPWKPGNVKEAPHWAMPHQPRLDWQMWFAALGNYRNNPWVLKMMAAVLKGEKPVLALFKTNPFPQKPPRYLRAAFYKYEFTNFTTRHKTGAWWQRQKKGLYVPVLSLSHS